MIITPSKLATPSDPSTRPNHEFGYLPRRRQPSSDLGLPLRQLLRPNEILPLDHSVLEPIQRDLSRPIGSYSTPDVVASMVEARGLGPDSASESRFQPAEGQEVIS